MQVDDDLVAELLVSEDQVCELELVLDDGFSVADDQDAQQVDVLGVRVLGEGGLLSRGT